MLLRILATHHSVSISERLGDMAVDVFSQNHGIELDLSGRENPNVHADLLKWLFLAIIYYRNNEALLQ